MAKQSFIQYTIQFIKDFNSFPFQDYYIFLVLRFLVYIYLFIKLSDILLGYEKPNLKTRVLRKFQFVYGEHILKELDKDDMQELQITIANTILNATKELSNKKNTHSSGLRHSSYLSRYYHPIDTHQQTKLYESERRNIRNQDIYESTSINMSKKSLKLKFDLERNQYFDPPSTLSSLITFSEKEQSVVNAINEYEVQGESQEENLSPKHQQKAQGSSSTNNFKKGQEVRAKTQIQLINNQQSQGKLNNTEKQPIQPQILHNPNYPNIHYPQQQLQGIDLQNRIKQKRHKSIRLQGVLASCTRRNTTLINLQIQEKLVKNQQNLLHLSEDNLNASLMGRQPFPTNSLRNIHSVNSNNSDREENGNFPSVIKTQSTKMTDTLVEDLET